MKKQVKVYKLESKSAYREDPCTSKSTRQLTKFSNDGVNCPTEKFRQKKKKRGVWTLFRKDNICDA